jgi:hypothetical protein
MDAHTEWADIPTSFLQAELARRQSEDSTVPSCGSVQTGTYNTSIHVLALILILVLSVAGSCLLPLLDLAPY